MVRLIPDHFDHPVGSMPLAIGLFVSVSVLVALCAKHRHHVPKKCETKTSDTKFVLKSPLASPRYFVTTISNKAIPFVKNKDHDVHDAEIEAKEERGFGEDGVWQKAILMGEKCRPAEFSGVIHYDYNGNQLAEPPLRSPRASPLPSFMFPVAKDAN